MNEVLQNNGTLLIKNQAANQFEKSFFFKYQINFKC